MPIACLLSDWREGGRAPGVASLREIGRMRQSGLVQRGILMSEAKGQEPIMDPDDLARALLTEFVENSEMNRLGEPPPDEKLRDRYRACTRLYRLALVLIVLLGEEQNQPGLSSVRDRLEALVFGEGQALVAPPLPDLRASMKDLRQLLFPPGAPRQMSWSRSWFGRIGLDETNPVLLAAFAWQWMDSFVTITTVVRKFRVE